VGCVKEGVATSRQDDAKSTLSSLQERSGMTLEQLVDTPDDFFVALRSLFGLGTPLIVSSIRRELMLSTVGHAPLNGRIEAFLLALDKTRASVEP